MRGGLYRTAMREPIPANAWHPYFNAIAAANSSEPQAPCFREFSDLVTCIRTNLHTTSCMDQYKAFVACLHQSIRKS